jgi:hypothetical protein
VSKDECVLEEYEIVCMHETKKFTELYFKNANRIANKGESEEDDAMLEEMEQMFTDLHFGKNNKEFEKKAAKLMEAVSQVEDEDGKDNSSDEEMADETPKAEKVMP